MPRQAIDRETHRLLREIAAQLRSARTQPPPGEECQWLLEELRDIRWKLDDLTLQVDYVEDLVLDLDTRLKASA